MTSITNFNYGHDFQIKVISALLNQKEFLTNTYDLINIEDFNSQSHKWIISEILKYFQEYHCNPTMEVMKIELAKIDNETLKISIKEQLREAYILSDSSDLDYIKTEYKNFCTNQRLKKALLNSVDLLKINDYTGIRNIINDALKAGQEKNIGLEYNKDVEYRYREESRSPIPFPWKTFNKITQEGYGKGDLILIFGNPGGGKSWVALSMASHAASLGYNIVYYTLELGETYVGKRIDACLTGIPVDELSDHKKSIEEIVFDLPGQIIVKEFPPKRASLDDIEKHLEQLDFVPDAIFIDYLDLLKNRKFRNDKKDDIDDVYVDAKGLAKTLQIPIISPSQVNRAGSKDDIIEGDKIAGSYDKIMIGDISISLSRKRKDKLNNTGRFHIMKNRYGGDGMTYFSKINTSNGDIQIDESPLDDDDLEIDMPTNKNKFNGIDDDEKKYLSKEFFKLNS